MAMDVKQLTRGILPTSALQ